MTSRLWTSVAFAIAILLTCRSAQPAEPCCRVTTQRVLSGGRQREVATFFPPQAAIPAEIPLVVVLHGSGGDGRALVESWAALASSEGFAVAGPTALDRREWSVPKDGPRFLYEVVEEMKRAHAVDGRRVYLFGHSAGGIFSLYMGISESEYFAAVATHGAALRGEADVSSLGLVRRIPMLLMVGTRDPLFPIDQVRGTADALRSRGFPATLKLLAGGGHGYAASAGMLQARAWEFLREHRLPAAPSYVPYEFEGGR